MEILRNKSYEEVSKEAAKIITKVIQENPKAILGLATGSTPLGLYNELIKEFNEGILDFSEVRTFNLDEYIGLTPEHEQSYRFFMENNLFKHINLKIENCQVPSGVEVDYDKYCDEYEKMIDAAGGMDLLILGVGENGHIAFNEPNTRLGSATHIIDLTEDTIKVNSRFFRSEVEVPRQAITMGMGTIMKAKKIVLLLTGKNKSHVLNRLLNEKFITAEFPVSFLMMHRDVTVIFDEEACGEI
ncbi:MAG: glucosamine-6-phosphate deaminase [Clostridiales bacterium]|nr:glucosamine-6-phosphate deaminase [Clostridiales bacterium]